MVQELPPSALARVQQLKLDADLANEHAQVILKLMEQVLEVTPDEPFDNMGSAFESGDYGYFKLAFRKDQGDSDAENALWIEYIRVRHDPAFRPQLKTVLERVGAPLKVQEAASSNIEKIQQLKLDSEFANEHAQVILKLMEQVLEVTPDEPFDKIGAAFQSGDHGYFKLAFRKDQGDSDAENALWVEYVRVRHDPAFKPQLKTILEHVGGLTA
ncbi:MAG: hypothetical protein SFY66_21425 [Oculatellaceae cyanobacterium bins.114]|nr:hypothetical protein [Oculatellaceae cyanobacterium bins.114]